MRNKIKGLIISLTIGVLVPTITPSALTINQHLLNTNTTMESSSRASVIASFLCQNCTYKVYDNVYVGYGYQTSGNNVKVLQGALHSVDGGKYNAGAADGIFGSKTLAALKAFQKDYGLSVDGIAGPNTWRKLGQVYDTRGLAISIY